MERGEKRRGKEGEGERGDRMNREEVDTKKGGMRGDIDGVVKLVSKNQIFLKLFD